MDDPKHLMRDLGVTNECSYLTAGEIMESIVQKAKIMNAWTKCMKTYKGNAASNVEDELGIVIKELDLELRRAQKTEHWTLEDMACSKSQYLIAEKVKLSTIYRNALV